MPIECQIYDMRWLRTETEFKKFYEFVADECNEKLFTNHLVQSLLVEQKYTRQIWWVFILYLVKLVCIWNYYYWIWQDK